MDSRAAWHALLDELLDEEGLPPLSAEMFAESFGQSSGEDARRFFGGRLSVAELDSRYAAAFPRHVAAVSRIEPDADAVIAELRRAGVRTAITTNAPGSTSQAMLVAAELSGVVETIVTPDDVALPKPAPDMLLEAMRRLDVTPAHTLLVGDSRSDVVAGRRAGIEVLGFRTDGGDRRIESLRALL